MGGMLALVAAVLFTESSALPKPFLEARPNPCLPISRLTGFAPASVARGNYWRPGGYARLTYYYRFPLGGGPTLAQIAERDGFRIFNATLGPNPGSRAVRELGGVRQVVFTSDLKPGESWRWAEVTGPATIISVTEMPMEGPAPGRWHQLPELEKAPVPPGFPTKLEFLREFPLYAVRSDAIIPHFPRTELIVWVILSAPRDVDALEKTADAEMQSSHWKKFRRRNHLRYENKLVKYGLIGVETSADQPDPNHLLIQLKYRFQDRKNGPKLQ